VGCCCFRPRLISQGRGSCSPCSGGLIDWLNTFIAHISILSNAHGTWSMFWSVLRRCHILRWDWSVLPLAHHSMFPFENFGAWWFLYVSTILWGCALWSAQRLHTSTLGTGGPVVTAHGSLNPVNKKSSSYLLTAPDLHLRCLLMQGCG
jgi:hypothetical protein